MNHTEAKPLNLSGVYFPEAHIAGTCLLCGGAADPRGDQVCPGCMGHLRAIIDAPKRDRRQIAELVGREDDANVLRVARANATGHWHRGLISERLTRMALCW